MGAGQRGEEVAEEAEEEGDVRRESGGGGRRGVGGHRHQVVRVQAGGTGDRSGRGQVAGEMGERGRGPLIPATSASTTW